MSDSWTFDVKMDPWTVLKVTLPKEYYAVDLIRGFAKAYVEDTMSKAIVSDEVLFSSIGAYEVREVMRLGIEEKHKKGQIDDITLNIFKDAIADNALWRKSVLEARR